MSRMGKVEEISDRGLALRTLTERTEKRDNGCWEWMGTLGARDYGRLYQGGLSFPVHRIAYFLHVGPIPDGMFVCHRCDNPPCVNPDHLFLGTNRDNVEDRDRKGRNGYSRRTHCPQGHPYTEANTYRAGGGRHCKTCQLERSREQREGLRA